MMNRLFSLVLCVLLFTACDKDELSSSPNLNCTLQASYVSDVFDTGFTYEIEDGKVLRKTSTIVTGNFYIAKYDELDRLTSLAEHDYLELQGRHVMVGLSRFTYNIKNQVVRKTESRFNSSDFTYSDYFYEEDRISREIVHRDNDTMRITDYIFDETGKNIELKESIVREFILESRVFETFEFDDQRQPLIADPLQFPNFNTNNITRMRIFATNVPDKDFAYTYTYNPQGYPLEVQRSSNGAPAQFFMRYVYECE